MRKFLLLLSFLTLFTAVKAQDPVVSITTVKTNQLLSNSSYTETNKAMLGVSGGNTWTTSGFNNNKKGWDNIRCGSKNQITTATITTDFSIDAAVNKVSVKLARFQTGTNDKITSIKLLVSSNADMSDATEAASITDFTEFLALSKTNTSATPTSTCTYDFEIAEPATGKYYQVEFAMPKTTANGVVGLLQVDYYGQVEEGSVASPVITLGEDDMVSITQADGADIYYTTDETDPTTASTKYETPFQITTVTTVKAIAVKDGKESAVTSKTLTPTILSSLDDFLKQKPTVNSKINSPLTAIYQCGRNLYLTDGTNFILAYNNNNVDALTNLGAVNGDVLSSITGTYKDQNGLPELIPSAVGEKTAGTAVQPEVLAIEEISSDILNKYVRIEGVNIEAASSNNYNATDETGTIVLYNTFYNASYYPNAIKLPDGTYGNTIPEGEGFTVEGFVSCYGKTLQITPIAITGGTVMETVAAPVFTPASGTALEVGAKITIECKTDGASIYFTTDDETPSADSQLYTGELTFSEAITIKAIAIKDGMLDSDVVTATYSLYDPNVTSAVFDFNNVATLSPAPEIPTESNTQIKLNSTNGNNSFISNSISLSFSDGTNTSNSPVIIYPTGASTKGQIEGRIYKNNTITVSGNQVNITKITFTQFDNSTTWAGFTTSPEANVTESAQAASATDKVFNFSGASEVVLTSIGTSRFKTIEVEYSAENVQGIEEIDTDNANAPVEYYNLQGIRVNGDNLTPGIYIRRQGSKTVKVLVK